MAVTALLLVASVGGAAGPSVSLESRQGRCSVHGGFAVPVSAQIVWEVLTDYDGIAKYVPSIEASRVERQVDGRLLLRQDAVAEAWFVRRRMHVLLEVDETPRKRIRFRDVLGKDFRSYAGGWTIAPGPQGTQVDYDLTAEPAAAIGRMFCRGAMHHTATELLTQVREEVLRRASGMPDDVHGR
jgi:ribosome-associated toxin RatA of RatAB toxin-antitoxin module